MPFAISPSKIRELIKVKHKSFFGTLDTLPTEVTFATQNKGEYVCIKVRKHVFTNFPWVLRAVLAITLIPLTYFSFGALAQLASQVPAISFLEGAFERLNNLTNSIPLTIEIILLVTYYSFIASYVLINYLNWYFNMYIVTNERIINIGFQAFTGKKVAEAPLSNIEDISQKSIGFFPSIFNYGNIRIQTAATKGKFNLTAVPYPTWFRDTLADLTKLAKIAHNHGRG